MEKAMLYLSLKVPASGMRRKPSSEFELPRMARDSAFSVLVLIVIAVLMAAVVLSVTVSVFEALESGRVEANASARDAEPAPRAARCHRRGMPSCAYLPGLARW